MSLGLPVHLARDANRRALADSSLAGALVGLAAAIVCVFAPGVSHPSGVQWWGVSAIVPIGVLLVVVNRTRSTAWVVALLAIGALCTYVYSVALLMQTPSYLNTDIFVIALPVIAMMAVGTQTRNPLAGVIWSTLAYFVADLAVFLSAVRTDREFTLDSISLGAYVFFMLLLLVHALTTQANRGAHSLVMKALREQRIADVRQDVAADVRTELHDTTLSQLSAIVISRPGPLSEQLRSRIQADLDRWTQRKPARPSGADAEAPTRAWNGTELAIAVDQARDSGLLVEVTGDRAAFLRLTVDRRRAIGMAVRQCLVNVMRHSGAPSAEVAISKTADEVSVMVVDGGRGFDVDKLGDDRMGLRHSVQARVERIGGTVAIFSRPGAGTSVLMIVPSHAVDERETAT